jgi:hypothetical protein
MKIRVFADVNGNSVEPVEQHVEPGTGKAMIAAGLAEEIIPQPIKHQPTEWTIQRNDENPSDPPVVYAKCNCKDGRHIFSGPAVKLEVRHVIMIPDEHFTGTGDFIFINSNTGKVKIVVEKCPVQLEQEYRQRYAAWAKRYARRPKKPSAFDVVQKTREAAIRGQLTGESLKRLPKELCDPPRL